MMHVIRLDNFEGPLDLLLKLIEERQLDITEVSLAQVTDQFLDHLRALQDLDLEVASEFAVVAARLLEIKAKSLLPPSPSRAEEAAEEEDTPDDLVRRLLEYRQFKLAAELLRQQGEREGQRYPRFPEDVVALAREVELEGLRLADLLRAMERVLAQAPEEATPTLDVRRERLSVEDGMRRLIWHLRRSGGRATFQSLFRPGSSRLEIVVTFLALLELLRRRRVLARQSEPFGAIEIILRGSEDGVGGP